MIYNYKMAYVEKLLPVSQHNYLWLSIDPVIDPKLRRRILFGGRLQIYIVIGHDFIPGLVAPKRAVCIYGCCRRLVLFLLCLFR